MLLNPNINLINQITEVYEKLIVKQFKQSSQHKKSFLHQALCRFRKKYIAQNMPFFNCYTYEKEN